MATFFMTVRGDQLGTFTGLSGDGNGVDRIVTLTGTTAIGTSDQLFTIRIDQAADGDTQFTNGQLITILDSNNNVIMTQSIVQPDIEQGLGAGDQHLIIQSTGFVIDLAGIDAATLQYGFTDEIGNASVGDNDGNLDFADVRTNFPCFATGTLIQTPEGPREIETLEGGDNVLDMAGNARRVIWAAARKVVLTPRTEWQRPICFRPDSLGPGQPAEDLLVSPQHCMLMQDAHDRRYLVPAKALLDLHGVRRALGRRHVTYHALLLDQHAVIVANGALAESFYPGTFILDHLPLSQRLDLFDHLGRALPADNAAYGPRAFDILTVAQGRDHFRDWNQGSTIATAPTILAAVTRSAAATAPNRPKRQCDHLPFANPSRLRHIKNGNPLRPGRHANAAASR